MKKMVLVSLGLVAFFIAHAQKIKPWAATDMTALYNTKSDSVYVISFWSTQCQSCTTQLPYLQGMVKRYERLKVKLLLVNVDPASSYPKKVKDYLKDNELQAETVWLDGAEVKNLLPVLNGGWNGNAPATLILNGSTGYKKFTTYAVVPDQFEKQLRRAINKD